MIGLIPRDNWEHKFSDLFRGLAGALVPRKQGSPIYIAGLGDCVPVRSGRAGLVVAIKALNLPPGAHIGVPLYCCSVVFKAIKTAGCIPRFIDVEPETFCMSTEDLTSKRSQLDAVIAVHMFGNMCDMQGLQEAAQGKPIIEDCAQALGSKIQGRLAGSFGTIAFFSFRSGKYLSVGEGGALFSNDPALCSRAVQFTDQMVTPNYADECAHAAKSYIKSILRSKPLYGIAGYHLWRFLNKKMNLSEKSGVALSKVFMSDLTLIRKRLPHLDSAVKKQRNNADYFSSMLTMASGMLSPEKPGAFYNRFHYPIIFPSMKHRDFIANYLLSKKIDTIKYLDDIVDVAAKHFGYAGDCPTAEQLSKRVLIIPSNYSLRKKDIQHIARYVNEGWEKIRDRAVVRDDLR